MKTALRLLGSFPLIGTVVTDKDGRHETLIILFDPFPITILEAHEMGKKLSPEKYWVNGVEFSAMT